MRRGHERSGEHRARAHADLSGVVSSPRWCAACRVGTAPELPVLRSGSCLTFRRPHRGASAVLGTRGEGERYDECEPNPHGRQRAPALTHSTAHAIAPALAGKGRARAHVRVHRGSARQRRRRWRLWAGASTQATGQRGVHAEGSQPAPSPSPPPTPGTAPGTAPPVPARSAASLTHRTSARSTGRRGRHEFVPSASHLCIAATRRVAEKGAEQGACCAKISQISSDTVVLRQIPLFCAS